MIVHLPLFQTNHTAENIASVNTLKTKTYQRILLSNDVAFLCTIILSYHKVKASEKQLLGYAVAGHQICEYFLSQTSETNL